MADVEKMLCRWSDDGLEDPDNHDWGCCVDDREPNDRFELEKDSEFVDA